MIVGLISDIHANIYGLDATLDALQQFKPELIVCAGDIVGYYPFVNEVIEVLRDRQIACVMGNHDAILTGKLTAKEEQWQRYVLDYASSVIQPDNLNWLCQLPLKLCFEIEGRTLEVYHGSPWAPLVEYIYPDSDSLDRFEGLAADFVILGHTHWPMQHRLSQLLVINPGSCGQPRDHLTGSSYALLNIQTAEVSFRRVSYDVKSLVNRARALKLDSQLIDIFCSATGGRGS